MIRKVGVVAVVVSFVLLLASSAIAFPAITEFPVPLASYHNHPRFIAAGPDGNLWFTLQLQKIGRISPDGVLKKFDLPSFSAQGDQITQGPDGALWFTQPFVNEIGRMTTSGNLTEFPVPSTPVSLTGGADGNIWFTEADNKVGYLTPLGAVKLFQVPTTNAGVGDIAAGPDGNVWFTESLASKVGRISPRGRIREFPLQTNRYPIAITPGPDGNLWFTENYHIGRMTPDGSLTEFRVNDVTMNGIVSGPDGRLWFTDYQKARVGWISMTGVHHSVLAPSGWPLGIAAGPDGNVWFVESIGNKIARVNLQ